MKTLLKTTLAFCLSLALVNQGFGAEEKMTKKDHIMMKDGKVMVHQNGKTMTLEKDMALENGTTVKTDGTVVTKSGEKMTLKDGDAIDMLGMKVKGHMKKTGDAKPTGDKEAGNTNNVTNTKTGGGVPTPKTGQPISPEPGKDTNSVTNPKTSGGSPK